MVVREHVGYGWGNPIDPERAEVWLCDGYVCCYDPRSPGIVELWTEFGRTDAGFARTNDGAHRIAYAEYQARGDGKWLREWLGATDPMSSRFD